MGSFALGPVGGQLNVAATNYGKDYRNNELIGDMLAPRVPMAKQTNQFVIHSRDGLRLDGDDLRAPGAAPRAIRSAFSTAFYNCKSHARMAEIPYETEQWGLWFGFSQQAKATRQVMDKLLLAREVELAAKAVGSGTTIALSEAAMWDNPNSSPIEQITAAKSTTLQSGVRPNVLILGHPVVDALVNNVEIINRVKYTHPNGVIDQVNMDQLSAVLGIKCIDGAAVQVDKGDNVSFVWGQNAILAYVQQVSDQTDLSSFKTFTWTAAPDTVDGYGVIIEPKYPLSSKAILVSADWYYDIQNTAPETTYTFTNCCAAPTYESLPAFPAAE